MSEEEKKKPDCNCNRYDIWRYLGIAAGIVAVRMIFEALRT